MLNVDLKNFKKKTQKKYKSNYILLYKNQRFKGN